MLKRRWVRACLGVFALFMVLLITDSLIAARTEHRISQEIYRDSHLANPPGVTVAAYPYVSAAFTHELQSVTVNAKDIDVPGFGLVSVHSSAQYITVSADDVFNGDIKDAPARKVFTRLQLDPVSVGSRMHVSDLLIQNKDDISPNGGWETEAIFEGTPQGFRKAATVEMQLRMREGNVHLDAIDVVKGPEDKGKDAKIVDGDDLDDSVRQEIMRAFSLDIPGDTLPFRGQPMRVYVAGGSVYVESERYYTRVSIEDLAPRSRPLSAEEQPGL